MSREITLSIYITTYNHERYIGEALDSILMQKTKYDYEIIIGDDASTDNTPNIIMQYKRKYPDLIHVILREKNMGGKGANNGYDLIKRCQGKFIIALEGDDFWIDDSKLEKQISFLENNLEYIGVAHNCVVVDENSIPNGETYPECKDEIYTLRHFASNILPGQLTTIMYRNIYKMDQIDSSLIEKGILPIDRLIYFMLASHGTIFCMQTKMSAYRHITQGGSSFSANYIWQYKEVKKWNLLLVEYAKHIKNKEAVKYSELLLMKVIIGARKYYHKSWMDILKELKREHFSLFRYWEYLLQLYRRKLLKKIIWA